jgi:hypothetical protein
LEVLIVQGSFENAHDAVAQPITEICNKSARSMPILDDVTIKIDYECKVFSSDWAGPKGALTAWDEKA